MLRHGLQHVKFLNPSATSYFSFRCATSPRLNDPPKPYALASSGTPYFNILRKARFLSWPIDTVIEFHKDHLMLAERLCTLHPILAILRTSLLKNDVEMSFKIIECLPSLNLEIRDHYVYPLLAHIEGPSALTRRLDLIKRANCANLKDVYKLYVCPLLNKDESLPDDYKDMMSKDFVSAYFSFFLLQRNTHINHLSNFLEGVPLYCIDHSAYVTPLSKYLIFSEDVIGYISLIKTIQNLINKQVDKGLHSEECPNLALHCLMELVLKNTEFGNFSTHGKLMDQYSDFLASEMEGRWDSVPSSTLTRFLKVLYRLPAMKDKFIGQLDTANLDYGPPIFLIEHFPGSLEQMEKRFEELRNDGELDLGLLSKIIHAKTLQNIDASDELQTLLGNEGVVHNITLSKLIQQCYQKGDYDKALEYRDYFIKNYFPFTKFQIYLFSPFVNIYASQGKFDLVLKEIENVRNHYVNQFSYSSELNEMLLQVASHCSRTQMDVLIEFVYGFTTHFRHAVIQYYLDNFCEDIDDAFTSVMNFHKKYRARGFHFQFMLRAIEAQRSDLLKSYIDQFEDVSPQLSFVLACALLVAGRTPQATKILKTLERISFYNTTTFIDICVQRKLKEPLRNYLSILRERNVPNVSRIYAGLIQICRDDPEETKSLQLEIKSNYSIIPVVIQEALTSTAAGSPNRLSEESKDLNALLEKTLQLKHFEKACKILTQMSSQSKLATRNLVNNTIFNACKFMSFDQYKQFIADNDFQLEMQMLLHEAIFLIYYAFNPAKVDFDHVIELINQVYEKVSREESSVLLPFYKNAVNNWSANLIEELLARTCSMKDFKAMASNIYMYAVILGNLKAVILARQFCSDAVTRIAPRQLEKIIIKCLRVQRSLATPIIELIEKDVNEFDYEISRGRLKNLLLQSHCLRNDMNSSRAYYTKLKMEGVTLSAFTRKLLGFTLRKYNVELPLDLEEPPESLSMLYRRETYENL